MPSPPTTLHVLCSPLQIPSKTPIKNPQQIYPPSPKCQLQFGTIVSFTSQTLQKKLHSPAHFLFLVRASTSTKKHQPKTTSHLFSTPFCKPSSPPVPRSPSPSLLPTHSLPPDLLAPLPFLLFFLHRQPPLSQPTFGSPPQQHPAKLHPHQHKT